MNYKEQCTKYFAPLDEIQEALTNNEGICGIGSDELTAMVDINVELKHDLELYG